MSVYKAESSSANASASIKIIPLWGKIVKMIAVASTILTLIGCGDPPSQQNPLPLPVTTAVKQTQLEKSPDRANNKSLSAANTQSPTKVSTAKVTRSLIYRLSTPGALRWKLNLKNKISALHWSPIAGLVVSVGVEVHNITSHGVDRWSVVAGKAHKLFTIFGEEILWSPQFKRLSHLMRFGRTGWRRNWNVDLAYDGRNGLYLRDAATICAIGQDGKDRWRISMENMRKLEGPFACDNGVLFCGIKGMERVAINISERGTIVRELMLERGSVLLGASRTCKPLVWNTKSVSLLDDRGIAIWKKTLKNMPIVKRQNDGFLLAVSGPDTLIQMEHVSDTGINNWNLTLPVKGRLTKLGVISEPEGARISMGLCMDVSSPCAKSEGTRGPYNTLITGNKHEGFRVLLRQIKGHLGFTQYPSGGIVTADSTKKNETDLTRRDKDGTILWTLSLSGRLTAGPSLGPNGEVYLATCNGWKCTAPYTMYSVTGMISESDKQQP